MLVCFLKRVMHGVHQSLMGILSGFHGPLSVRARQGGEWTSLGSHTPHSGCRWPEYIFHFTLYLNQGEVKLIIDFKTTLLSIIYISIYQYISHNNFKYNVDICRYLTPPEEWGGFSLYSTYICWAHCCYRDPLACFLSSCCYKCIWFFVKKIITPQYPVKLQSFDPVVLINPFRCQWHCKVLTQWC